MQLTANGIASAEAMSTFYPCESSLVKAIG